MKSDALHKKVCVKLNFGQKDGVKWNMIESSGSLSLSLWISGRKVVTKSLCIHIPEYDQSISFSWMKPGN